MKTLDYLHLNESTSATVVASLKQLLADFQVHYMNLRGFHWNIKGRGFFVLHAKFEELYNDAAEKVDQIAERIFSEMHRGVTLLDGEGWYTKTPTKVVMVVCRKNETGILFRVIKEVDPHAFMTFGSVMGVYGLGFEALKK